MKVKTFMPTMSCVVIATALLGLASHAQAEKGDLTVVPKYGQTDASNFDFDGDIAIKAEGDSAFGLAIGYELDANWTAELMYVSGEGDDNEEGFLPLDIEYTSIGVYGVYRSSINLGSPYLFARIGLSRSDVTIEDSISSAKDEDTGASFGAGLGYQYSPKLGFEAEYYRDSDIVSFILVSARFHLDN